MHFRPKQPEKSVFNSNGYTSHLSAFRLFKLFRYKLWTLILLFSVNSLFAAKVTPPITLPLPAEEDFCDYLSYHDDGSCKEILYYKVDSQSGPFPYEIIEIYENGMIARQAEVSKKGSDLILDGHEIVYHRNGSLASYASYRQGKLEGKRALYDAEGTLLEEGNFKEGQKEGPFSYYGPLGKLKVSCNYIADKIEGMLIEYDDSGNKIAMAPYKQGLLHGKKISWHLSGEVKSIEYFQEGLLQDTPQEAAFTEYSPQGAVVRSGRFQKGVAHGEHREFHPNLREKSCLLFINGKIDGPFIEYDPQGVILYQGKYRLGIKIGEHQRFHSPGKIAFQAAYDDKGTSIGTINHFYANGTKEAEYCEVEGLKEGPFLSFYENGASKVFHHYEKGLLHGKVTEWYPDGTVAFEGHFENGEKDGAFQLFDQNGTLVKSMTYVKGLEDGLWNEYYPGGTLKQKVSFSNGKRHGIEEFYYENGAIAQSIIWKEGLKEGPFRGWYDNGQLRVDGSYLADKEDGLFIEYNREGKVTAESAFTLGMRHGRVAQKDPSGMVTIFEAFFDHGMLHGELNRFTLQGSPAFKGSYFYGRCIGEQISWYPLQDEFAEPKVAFILHFNDMGQKDGSCSIFYPDGKVKRELVFQNGVMNGPCKEWAPDGRLARSAYFKLGLLDGACIEQDGEGRVHTVHFENGKKEGPYTIHIEAEGQKRLLRDAFFVADKLDGVVSEYEISGAPLMQLTMKHGKKEGAAYYYQNGHLHHTLFYHEDLPHGTMKEYFANGSLEHEVDFIMGQKDGVERYYFADGSLRMEYHYKEGKYHGLAQTWNQQGILVFEADYICGKKHGKFNKYNDDGTPRLCETFVDDKLDGWKISYNDKGVMQKSRYSRGIELR